MSANTAQSYLDLYFETLYSDLTILSFGGGQDSTTILFKLALDKEFSSKYISKDGKLLVIMADTHNEHPETYKYLEDIVIPFCKKYNIEFLKIDNSMGFHGKTWQSLTGQWENKNPTIGSVAYPKTCTHNLKLVPQYNYVEQWLPKNYNKINNKTRKDNYVQFAKYYGKIRWLIGIAKGEESRMADAEKETAKWKKQSIEIQYPLIDFGLDRQACQDYIKSINKPIPMPSNCMYCPFACNHMELLWLEKAYPEKFEEWIKLEQDKLDHHAGAIKNLGVSGKLHKKGAKKGKAYTLRDVLAEAKGKYPNITLNELNEYKWSHGHCVSSKY